MPVRLSAHPHYKHFGFLGFVFIEEFLKCFIALKSVINSKAVCGYLFFIQRVIIGQLLAVWRCLRDGDIKRDRVFHPEGTAFQLREMVSVQVQLRAWCWGETQPGS